MQHILGRSFGKLPIRESVLTILDFENIYKIQLCHFLFQDEIENMVRQGEEHAAADLLIKERIEAVNQGKLFEFFVKCFNTFRYCRQFVKFVIYGATFETQKPFLKATLRFAVHCW